MCGMQSRCAPSASPRHISCWSAHVVHGTSLLHRCRLAQHGLQMQDSRLGPHLSPRLLLVRQPLLRLQVYWPQLLPHSRLTCSLHFPSGMTDVSYRALRTHDQSLRPRLCRRLPHDYKRLLPPSPNRRRSLDRHGRYTHRHHFGKYNRSSRRRKGPWCSRFLRTRLSGAPPSQPIRPIFHPLHNPHAST